MTYTRQESLRAWVGNGGQGERGRPRGDRLELSDEARRLLEAGVPAQGDPLKDDIFANVAPADRVRLLILSLLLGIDVSVLIGAKAASDAERAAQAAGAAPAPRPNWGAEYRLDERYEETEKLTVSAQGVIHTADGQTIAFAVDLNLSRQFVQEGHLHVLAGNARPVDPLVINYAGPAAELTERKFSFDLEVGGQVESIPFLREGSGFLTLDKDGDGKVGSGAELFGPGTGDGFAELAKYDADGNHWIDQNDPIFDRLRIWTKDATGADRLFALGQKGIGAIYVGAVDAGFTMADPANRAIGVNQKAGLFLRENGTAGTVQQLDLMV